MATTLTISSPRGGAQSSSFAAVADQLECRRQYAPSPWGEFFLTNQPCTPEELLSMEEKARAKKEEVRRIVLDTTAGDHHLAPKLDLVDALQRLGVDYHYKEEIDVLLRAAYDDNRSSPADDLYVTSLRFYLLRKHGYAVSSGTSVRPYQVLLFHHPIIYAI